MEPINEPVFAMTVVAAGGGVMAGKESTVHAAQNQAIEERLISIDKEFSGCSHGGQPASFVPG